jgi:MOB kinase activator 1
MKQIPPSSSRLKRSSRLQKIAQDTLQIGNLNLAVELPEGEILNEWLAVKTIEFYKEISLLFGCLTEFCTEASCPTMTAGNRFEYLWADSTSLKKPMKVPASKYIGKHFYFNDSCLIVVN